MAVQCGNVSKVAMENLLLKSLIKIFIFCAKSFNFNQTYLKTGLKTQNGEELSLDLIFHNSNETILFLFEKVKIDLGDTVWL